MYYDYFNNVTELVSVSNYTLDRISEPWASNLREPITGICTAISSFAESNSVPLSSYANN